MIYTRIKGGLGNQLFQYALGRTLALKYNTELIFDPSWFREFPYRLYQLEEFNTAGRRGTNMRERIGFLQIRHAIGRRARFLQRLPPFLPHIRYVEEEHFHFDPAILDTPDNSYIEGHFQTEKYFESIASILRKDLTLKNPSTYFTEMREKMSSCTSISLHVRRGDYASNPKTLKSIGLAPIEYYKNAAALIAQQVQNPVFFIFSDDLAWVKENIPLSFPIHYVEHPEKKDYEEPLLMASCKHQIISNSSFSWWGAWLNPDPQKIVCAPKVWFVDPTSDTRDIIPENWYRL